MDTDNKQDAAEPSPASDGSPMVGQRQRFDSLLDRMLYESRKQGFAEGLAVAVKIRGWLTRQPDREWQREIRKWADAEILKAERYFS